MPDEPTDDRIREIVREELEQHQPTIGRRGVLASAAAAASLGAAGYHFTRTVRASSHGGEIGRTDALARIWAETIRDANDDVILDVTNGGALNVNDASAGTVSGKGGLFRLVERRTPSTDTTQIQFSGLSADTEYKIYYKLTVRASGFLLRFNGDGATTGNYYYFDEAGVKQSGENQIELISVTNSYNAVGNIRVDNGQFNASGAGGVNHEFTPTNLPDRLTGFAREGGNDDVAALSSIELICDDGFNINDNAIVELWERDYS